MSVCVRSLFNPNWKCTWILKQFNIRISLVFLSYSLQISQLVELWKFVLQTTMIHHHLQLSTAGQHLLLNRFFFAHSSSAGNILQSRIASLPSLSRCLFILIFSAILFFSTKNSLCMLCSNAATCSVRFPLLMPKLCEAFTEMGLQQLEQGGGKVDRKTLEQALDPYRLRHRQQSRQPD